MRFKQHIKLSKGLTQIDIAPLIDVIFQLLIFFMLSSSFTFQSGINVKLPKAVTSDIIKEENYIITITSENVMYLNGEVTTVKELKNYLKSNVDPSRPILIKADRRASMGRIVDVWDICRSLGLEKLNIATNQDL
ncbi:MAG: biopolymer transporter ExbD [Candidatus Omnitrophica bacterium]|nr:biopolymer transporter ExbD [Candidatus Omnitrophota bacterium]